MNDNPQPKRDAALADALPDNQDTTVPAADKPAQQKKRRSRPVIVLLLLLVIALLGGSAAVLGYQYFMPQKSSQTTNTPETVTPKALTAKSVINGIKPLYKTTPLTDGIGVMAPIKVASYDYYTRVSADKAVAVTGSVIYTDSAIVTAKIAKNLKEKQFVEKIIQAGTEDGPYLARFTQSDVVCEVTTTKTANSPTGNHEVEVACANMSDYVAAAAAQKPFFTAYPKEQRGDEVALLFVGLPTITPSKTAGYKTASLSMSGVQSEGTETVVGGFAGLFYQTPEMKWRFFIGAQDSPQCSDYKTDDLKKAYLGATCGESTGKEALVTL